jgi:succinate dehydrogenase / fumarate reductase, cytochrome b subunit
MTTNSSRPLSPHLSVYRWGPHMAASIVHRATGFILATAGVLTLLWWLSAIASGAESYAVFQKFALGVGDGATTFSIGCNWLFRILGVVLLLSFFQHLFSGIRHLLMDLGAGFELTTSRNSAWIVFIGSVSATAFVILMLFARQLGV